ncbi:MAG: hypothetical protein KAR35_05760, partial [Candidatus Heimdallarchaeota archaeon]|nr:hypothetical protein [Candidatus Heimdallarchaeota archaeon]MCK5048864.1 hypothetical protein [Candidatus Heimdallarchaeota archaeon]
MPIISSLQQKSSKFSNLFSDGIFSIYNRNQLLWSISTDKSAQHKELIEELAPFRVNDSDNFLFSSETVESLYHELLPASQNFILLDGVFKGTSLAVALYFVKQYSLKSFTFSVQSFGCSQNQA